jgi:hypothetical protein
MGHRVRVESWVGGILNLFETEASSLDEARLHVQRHREHHSHHGHDFTIKVYDPVGQLLESYRALAPLPSSYA